MSLVQSEFNGNYLTFDETKHRYILNGERVPGPTTFIKEGFPVSEGLINWKIEQGARFVLQNTEKLTSADVIKGAKVAWKDAAQAAANIGTIVHDYAYLTEVGKEAEAQSLVLKSQDLPDWNKIKNGMNKFDAWKDENNDQLLFSEAIVANITHKFGGKFDRLAVRHHKLVLSDFKTSSGIFVDMFIQLGAYSLAIKEWLGQEVDVFEILRFGKEDGEFQVQQFDSTGDLIWFEQQAIRCRETYEFKKFWESKPPFKRYQRKTK